MPQVSNIAPHHIHPFGIQSSQLSRQIPLECQRQMVSSTSPSPIGAVNALLNGYIAPAHSTHPVCAVTKKERAMAGAGDMATAAQKSMTQPATASQMSGVCYSSNG